MFQDIGNYLCLSLLLISSPASAAPVFVQKGLGALGPSYRKVTCYYTGECETETQVAAPAPLASSTAGQQTTEPLVGRWRTRRDNEPQIIPSLAHCCRGINIDWPECRQVRCIGDNQAVRIEPQTTPTPTEEESLQKISDVLLHTGDVLRETATGVEKALNEQLKEIAFQFDRLNQLTSKFGWHSFMIGVGLLSSAVLTCLIMSLKGTLLCAPIRRWYERREAKLRPLRAEETETRAHKEVQKSADRAENKRRSQYIAGKASEMINKYGADNIHAHRKHLTTVFTDTDEKESLIGDAIVRRESKQRTSAPSRDPVKKPDSREGKVYPQLS